MTEPAEPTLVDHEAALSFAHYHHQLEDQRNLARAYIESSARLDELERNCEEFANSWKKELFKRKELEDALSRKDQTACGWAEKVGAEYLRAEAAEIRCAELQRQLAAVAQEKQLVAWHYYREPYFYVILDQEVAPNDPIRSNGCPLYAIAPRSGEEPHLKGGDYHEPNEKEIPEVSDAVTGAAHLNNAGKKPMYPKLSAMIRECDPNNAGEEPEAAQSNRNIGGDTNPDSPSAFASGPGIK